MTWWMVLLLIFGILFLIGCIPVGVDAAYLGGSFTLKVKIWLLRLQILPAKPKKPKMEKASAAKDRKKPAGGKDKAPDAKEAQTADGAEMPAQEPPKKTFLTGGVQEILDLARLAADTLGNLRRKLRMEELMLRVRFGGGDDAAKTAILYGRAWAVIGALLPCLERIFVIKKRDIGAELDYNVDEKMAVDAHMVLTITIGRALALALRAGIGFLKIYQAYQDKNKGGAVHESSSE